MPEQDASRTSRTGGPAGPGADHPRAGDRLHREHRRRARPGRRLLGAAVNRSGRACCCACRSAGSASASSRGRTASCPRDPTRRSGSRRRRATNSSQALDAELVASEEEIGRRKLLVRLLAGAAGALGLAALFPIRSLGPKPGAGLEGQPVHGRRPPRDRARASGCGRRTSRWTGSSPCSRRATPTTPTARRSSSTLRPGQNQPRPGSGRLDRRRPDRLLEDLHPRRLPGRALPGAERAPPVPVPPVDLRGRATGRSRSSARPPARCRSCRSGLDADGYLIATGDFSAPIGPGFWDQLR